MNRHRSQMYLIKDSDTETVYYASTHMAFAHAYLGTHTLDSRKNFIVQQFFKWDDEKDWRFSQEWEGEEFRAVYLRTINSGPRSFA